LSRAAFVFDEGNNLGVSGKGQDFATFKSFFNPDNRGFGYIKVQVGFRTLPPSCPFSNHITRGSATSRLKYEGQNSPILSVLFWISGHPALKNSLGVNCVRKCGLVWTGYPSATVYVKKLEPTAKG